MFLFLISFTISLYSEHITKVFQKTITNHLTINVDKGHNKHVEELYQQSAGSSGIRNSFLRKSFLRKVPKRGTGNETDS